MADQSLSDFQQKEYELYLDERKQLIDAARESSRTFDKAVLTFGAAVFGASIAFLKDIAPIPAAETMKWLGASWLLFSLGLLAILLSFVFSHRACMFEIDVGQKALGSCDFKRKRNLWSVATISCNFLCIALLFIGLLCWSRFAFENLSHKEAPMDKLQISTEKRGYVPPAPPAKAPSQQQAPPPTTQSTPKK
jgi:hypothetical protein